MTVEEATRALDDAGFDAAVYEGDPGDVAAIVVAQEPGGRVKVESGAVVGLRTRSAGEPLHPD